jgi:hypothetical protein
MNKQRSKRAVGAVVGAIVALAGCGSSAGTISAPYIAPAKTFTLSGFQPAGGIVARRATTISFTVREPSGKPLTQYRTGPGPHTGVHLIIVRDDLAYIIHQHPPVGQNGLLRQTVTFPAPGPYKVLVDLYPNIPGGQPNFQLFRTVDVAGAYRPPSLHAIQAQFVNVEVTDPHGRKVTFVPWFGALAHAIFFRDRSLDYFHTHICAPNAANCGALPGVGATRITGRSTAPGKLTVGVLVPVPGIWRLFLQMKLGGRIVTAPFTLHVAS